MMQFIKIKILKSKLDNYFLLYKIGLPPVINTVLTVVFFQLANQQYDQFERLVLEFDRF